MIQSDLWVDRPRLESHAIQVRQVQWPPRGWTTEILSLLNNDKRTVSLSHHLRLPAEEVSTIRFAELADCDQLVFVAEQNTRLLALLRVAYDRFAGSLIGLNLASVEDIALATNIHSQTISNLLSEIQTTIPYPIDLWTIRVPNTHLTVLSSLKNLGFVPLQREVRAVRTTHSVGRRHSVDFFFRIAQPEESSAICKLFTRHQGHTQFDKNDPMTVHHLYTLQHWQVERAIESIHKNVFLMVDRNQRLLASAIYERIPRLTEFDHYPLARVSHLAFDTNTHHLGVEFALFAGLVQHLQEEGFYGVQVEIPLAGLGSISILESLQAIGFEIESIVRCLHWWPHRSSHNRSLPDPVGLT